MKRDVYVTNCVRTPIGEYGGALKDLSPTELGTRVVKETILRDGLDATLIEHLVFANVIHTEPRDMYLSRAVAILSGLPESAPAFNVNRLCGSGLQAMISAAQIVSLGDADVVIAGGAEVMSRGLYANSTARWGQRMGDSKLVDMMVGALTDPFANIHMGVTAENVAERFGVTREDQDNFALESHRRASKAWKEKRFNDQILPIEIVGRGGTTLVSRDEHVRDNLTLSDLEKSRPVFKREGGTVTAGNASSINDGAAAMTLMSEEGIKNTGATPVMRIVGYAHSGVQPEIMGIGPIPAVREVLRKTGIASHELAVIESNEAFAAQACAVTRELDFDPSVVNPNGGAIALGHPIGATGAILVTKLAYELKRTSARYGLVTLCIGGGQGIAALFERT